jgi:hypothetical protein
MIEILQLFCFFYEKNFVTSNPCNYDIMREIANILNRI